MNPQLLTQKRSVFAAMAAVACFTAICQADETPATSTQHRSPRTIIAENLPPVAPDRTSVRLATGAAPQGWMGPMPTRGSTVPPEPLVPPPAPPLEPPLAAVHSNLYPAPVPPAAIRRNSETPPTLSLRRGTTLPHLDEAKLTASESAATGQQPLRVRPISQPATSQPATPDEPSTITGETEASAAVQTPQAMTDVEMLLYGRPLTSVSLSSAIQPETLNGEALKTPEDHAGAIFASFGVYQELPAVRYAHSCQNKPSPMFFNPLYFEDPNLERCGQGHGCFTELVSVVRFFGRVPVVPYMIGANPPLSCVPSLGDCPTCHRFGCDAYLPPLGKDATALQTACTVGLIFLLP